LTPTTLHQDQEPTTLIVPVQSADSGNQQDPLAVKWVCCLKEVGDSIFQIRQKQAHYCKCFVDSEERAHANRPVDIGKKTS
jgi:hypothetical protein